MAEPVWDLSNNFSVVRKVLVYVAVKIARDGNLKTRLGGETMVIMAEPKRHQPSVNWLLGCKTRQLLANRGQEFRGVRPFVVIQHTSILLIPKGQMFIIRSKKCRAPFVLSSTRANDIIAVSKILRSSIPTRQRTHRRRSARKDSGKARPGIRCNKQCAAERRVVEMRRNHSIDGVHRRSLGRFDLLTNLISAATYGGSPEAFFT